MMTTTPGAPSRQRTIITAACFAVQAVGVGTYIAYGVFFTPLMEEFGWSRALISGASSAAFIVGGLFAILVGRLNDRVGPRAIMTLAAIIYGLGYALMARVDSVAQLYLTFGLIFGVGLSAIDVIALSTIARWFSHNRGKITGIVKVGTGAGQFVIPLLAGFLIHQLGFRTAFVILGTGAGLLLLIIAQFLRRDPGTTSPDAPAEARNDTGLSASQAMKTLDFKLLFLANLLLVAVLMSIMIHMVPHARDLGIPPQQAAGLLAAIGAVSMVGRFTSGFIIDKTGSKPIMLSCFVLLMAALVWLPQAQTLTGLYLFTLVYGLAHGGCFTAISPLTAELFGLRAHGNLFGLVVFAGTAGGAVGPLLTGWIFDINKTYTPAFMLLIIIALIAYVFFSNLKPGTKKEEC